MRRVGEARVRFDPEAIRDWDTQIKRMTGDGINVVAVILNPLADARGKGLIHPDTDVKNAPFKLTTARAVASYVGALGFLAERYSRPDKRYGLIGGMRVEPSGRTEAGNCQILCGRTIGGRGEVGVAGVTR